MTFKSFEEGLPISEEINWRIEFEYWAYYFRIVHRLLRDSCLFHLFRCGSLRT